MRVKIVDSDEFQPTASDADEMNRARKAVSAAIENAFMCNKPVARYNPKNKTVYWDYGNGKPSVDSRIGQHQENGKTSS